MNWGMVRAIIILPVMALIFIPAATLWVSGHYGYQIQLLGPHQVLFWFAIFAFIAGIILAVWTSGLFLTLGKGTPAPWEPPKNLVIRGPYVHVRNPMIIAVIIILLGESLLCQSWAIGVWMALFFIGNAIYFPLFEEKGLEKRFGDAYRRYKANVPRWIPRIQGWSDSPQRGRK
jgi:protein-S-isoprenylcysteine O-methyltransferase Ste14